MNIEDISKFGFDRLKYKSSNKALFWFQKNHGTEWLKGQNFGDYLSYVIVGEMLARRSKNFSNFKFDRKMLAIGSVMHFAETNDVIWGSGINGKISSNRFRFNDLDVRAVRGPLTHKKLEERNISVPNIYGDPALLLKALFPKLKKKTKNGKYILLPNLNEFDFCYKNCPNNMKLVSPMRYWLTVVKEILSSELVITSSLHGLIISDLYGVPVKFVRPFGGETLFKYEDYYLGTNREPCIPNDTFKDKISENSGVKSSPLIFDPTELMNAFPYDLYNG